jgi:hypothetical protein
MRAARLAGLLLLASCTVGTPSFPPPTDPFSGVWELTSISGAPLPFAQPDAPPPAGSAVVAGSTIRRGALGVYIGERRNSYSALELCQEWTDSRGVRREPAFERIYIQILGDSIRLEYVDKPGRPVDTGRLEGGQMRLTQRVDGREFMLTRAGHWTQLLRTCG